MNVSELRKYLKQEGVKGCSTVKKAGLLAKVQALEAAKKLKKYEESLKSSAVCEACLNQQRIQRKIDEKIHSERLLGLAIQNLVCEHCSHSDLVEDGDSAVCALCGGLQSPDVL